MKESEISSASASSQDRPVVLVFTGEQMGKGNDELGGILTRTFIHTLCEQKTRPDKIIFYNTGVKLAARGSEVVDDLRRLEADGAELLICGTCAKYFNMTENLGAGKISNMHDISEAMCNAGRLITP